jgi:hypothetical protein
MPSFPDRNEAMRTRPTDTLQVFVSMIDQKGRAHVRDQIGRQTILDSNLVAGRKPREGESWIVVNQQGYYVFDKCLVAVPPTITGQRAGSTALANLLATMAADGTIVDDTTAGSGGGGGGGAGKRPATVVVGSEHAGHTADEVDFLAETGNVKAALEAAWLAAVDKADVSATILMLPGLYLLEDNDDPIQWLTNLGIRVFGNYAVIQGNSTGPIINYVNLATDGLMVQNQGNGPCYEGMPGDYAFSSITLSAGSFAVAFGEGAAIDAASFPSPTGAYVYMLDSSQVISGGGPGIINATSVVMRSGSQVYGVTHAVVGAPGVFLDVRLTGVETTLFSNYGEIIYSDTYILLTMRDSAALSQSGTNDPVSMIYGWQVWLDIDGASIYAAGSPDQPETQVFGSDLGTFGGTIRNSTLTSFWGLGMYSAATTWPGAQVGIKGNRLIRLKNDCADPYIGCENPDQDIVDNRFEDGLPFPASTSTTVDVQAAGGGCLVARNRFVDDDRGQTSINVRSGAVGSVLRGNTGTATGARPVTADAGTGTVID